MALLPLRPVLVPEHLLKGGLVGRLVQVEPGRIVKLVKGGLGGRDAVRRVLLGAHGDPRIRHLRDRLELVLVDDLDGEPPSRRYPKCKILEECRQVLHVVDGKKEEAGVREFARGGGNEPVGIGLPPLERLMLFFRQRRRRFDDVLGEANHGGGLVHADGLGHPLFGKKARGHAGSAADVEDPHLFHGRSLGPFL